MSEQSPELGTPPALRLRRIALHNFRNYRNLVFEPAGRIAVITGPNGAGKTNLLEAISLLTPGRGLRGARIAELARRGTTPAANWAVAARLAHPTFGPIEVATGTPLEGPETHRMTRRIFRLDRVTQTNRAAIASRVAIAWLTPAMTRLFREGAQYRRRFLDHMVLALESSHARELAAFDAAMQSRTRLLQSPCPDPTWLAGLELSMARHGVAIAWARNLLVRGLSRALAEAPLGLPPLALTLASPIAARLADHPALEVEEWLAQELLRRRAADRAAAAAELGAHRADLLITTEHGAPATLASSGEQQALLLALVLAQASLLAEQKGFTPLLLLDEPTAHLDARRRAHLFARLRASPAQSFLTAVEPEPFRPLAPLAEFLTINEGAIDDGKIAGKN